MEASRLRKRQAVAPPGVVRHIELLSPHHSATGLDPPVANVWNLRAITMEEADRAAKRAEPGVKRRHGKAK